MRRRVRDVVLSDTDSADIKQQYQRSFPSRSRHIYGDASNGVGLVVLAPERSHYNVAMIYTSPMGAREGPETAYRSSSPSVDLLL